MTWNPDEKHDKPRFVGRLPETPEKPYSEWSASLKLVWNILLDGKPRTAIQINEFCNFAGGSNTASARARDLRKREFGSHDVPEMHGVDRCVRYKLTPNLYTCDRLGIPLTREEVNAPSAQPIDEPEAQEQKPQAIEKAETILGAHEAGPQPEPPGYWLKQFDELVKKNKTEAA